MHHSALQRWLQLTLSWKLGASALNKLLTQAGSVEALCSLPHSQPAALGLSAAAWPAEQPNRTRARRSFPFRIFRF